MHKERIAYVTTFKKIPEILDYNFNITTFPTCRFARVPLQCPRQRNEQEEATLFALNAN